MNKKEIFEILIMAALTFLRFLFEEIDDKLDDGEANPEFLKPLFPMRHIRITQGENVGSHLGSLAQDFAGSDAGRDWLFAPCDFRVVRTRSVNGELYIESLNKVQFPDGSQDYLSLLLLHDTKVRYDIGDIIKQNEAFYCEGGQGSGIPNKFGNHVHIEGKKGQWKRPYQFKNSAGTYVIEDQESLFNLFYVSDDFHELTPDKLKFKNVND